MRKNALIAAILLLAGAIPASAGKVAVVDPVVSPEVGSADGVKFVLGYEAERLFGLDLVRIPATCGDVTCAARIGRAAGVSKIVFAQAQKLASNVRSCEAASKQARDFAEQLTAMLLGRKK